LAANPQLKTLRELHELDRSIISLRKRHEAIAPETEAVQQTVAELRKQVENLAAETKRTRTEAARGELEIKSAEANIRKLIAQQNQVKTDKEYKSLQQEIATQRADLSRMEDETLQLLARIDELEAQRKSVEKRLVEEEATAKKRCEDLEAERRKIEEELAVLAQRRTELSHRVEPDLLEKYEFILARRGETALAAVSEATGWACQACYTQLTPQMCALLVGGKIVSCQSCARILYLAE